MKNFGFSLVELIVSITILVTITAIGMVSAGQSLRRSNFTNSQEIVLSAIRKVQAYSFSSKNGGIWGMCLSGSDLLIFRGTCASPVVSERFTLDGGAQITGLASTMFNTRGEPASAINLTLTVAGKSGVMGVNLAGGITY